MTDGARSNAREVAAMLQARAVKVQAKAVLTTQEFTVLLETRVKANASGRPGPRAQTGNYRRSITGRVAAGPVVTGTVGTNAPQGNRLENGFIGADSLGRIYNQPPYAHFGPAATVTEPEFFAALSRILG